MAMYGSMESISRYERWGFPAARGLMHSRIAPPYYSLSGSLFALKKRITRYSTIARRRESAITDFSTAVAMHIKINRR